LSHLDHDWRMATRDRPADRGRRRAREALVRLGPEVRNTRNAAGLSQREVARAAGIVHSRLGRFERGRGAPALTVIGAIMAVVGLDLSVKAYPAGDPIRDRPQLALLDRLRVQVHRALRWRTEVVLPLAGDLRGWDAVVTGTGLLRGGFASKPRPGFRTCRRWSESSA
jgi:transcriptional regulator with XRE-family HTH domain